MHASKPQMMKDHASDVGIAALQAAPGVAVSAAAVSAKIDLPWVVAALTGVFLILQIGYLGWKWRHEARERSKREAAEKAWGMRDGD